MKIHEYQAKKILANFGVTIPEGDVADTPQRAKEIALELKRPVVIKAQIHAGGRGKAGGIKIANTPEEAEKIADEMLGKKLVTYQTGPEGKIVRKVLVEESLDIEKELYLGIVLDRVKECPVVMASPEGGVEIEKTAEEHPELIFKEWTNPATGLLPFQARNLALAIGLKGPEFLEATKFILSLFRAFESEDSSLAEINPLILTKDKRVIALDAKMNFDDNALFRHPEILEMRDIYEEDPLEVEASKYNLNYIKLNGSVGCMVNGAGLAMATMDIIKHYGGEPANFLDVGGGANEEQVRNAFKILISDKNVRAALINIFGGIMRCDIVAQGVINVAKEIGIKIPMVVRLEGTNVNIAQDLLKKSGLNFSVASTMKEAAEMAVSLAKKEILDEYSD
ncbi:MAG: ADP-forming succinate--CoA ligase subunit beta [Acidobacteriota bacterium]